MNERINSEKQSDAIAEADTEIGHEQPVKPEPKIYVADLAAYNNGNLHGVWLDAARDPADIYDDIHAMLAASPMNATGENPPEEFTIHDFEQFGNCCIHEYDSIELVSKIARGIAEHGYAFAAWADVQEGNPELFGHFAKAYIGRYESLDAYVQQGLEARGADTKLTRLLTGSDLADLIDYIKVDAQAMARDLYLSGDIYVYRVSAEQGGGVWLFSERE
ncbi:antirestriction protein ArdA [Nocardia sp. SC052]|uniref:antirestriction protein ArdA n=1 Tax=Nocardia sichangensis TaxID=3385975 RepID=UPI00399FA5D3